MSYATATRHQPPPTRRVVRNNALWLVAALFGAIAGVLGIEHGYFETRQGNETPGGIVISAVGPLCRASQAWHGCEPALTIIPNMRLTGILAMIAGVAVVLWAVAFVQRRHGGLILLLLTLVLFLVGGGFTTLFFGMVAGVLGTQIHTPMPWFRAHRLGVAVRLLAVLWPWVLIAYLVWFVVEPVLGYFFNDFVLKLTPLMTIATPVLLLLVVAIAYAHDIRKQWDTPPAVKEG